MVDNRHKSGAFALGSSLSHLLHRAQQIAADRFAESVADPTLTLRQFALLAAIGEQKGRSQTALVRATGIDRSTLADMIARLEDRGLVERRSADADKRANAVSLTAVGERALSAATPGAAAADDALSALLPKNRRGAFLDALQGMALKAEATGIANGEATSRKTKDLPAKAAKGDKAQGKKGTARVTEAPAKPEPAPPKAGKNTASKNKAAKAEALQKPAKTGKVEKIAKPEKAAKAAKAGKPAKPTKAGSADKKRKKKKG